MKRTYDPIVGPLQIRIVSPFLIMGGKWDLQGI